MKYNKLFIVMGISAAFSGCASHKVDVNKVGGLRESKNMIELAKDEGASKYAPQALKIAEDTLDKASQVMYENKDMAVVDAQVKATHAAANRALLITRESKRFASMPPEAVATWTESKLTALRAPLSITEAANEPFNKQFSEVEEAVSHTAKLGAQAKGLQSKTAVLEKDKALNDRYNEVRKYYTEEEADILRDGNNLIVRLKAMEFPSGKAEIKPQYFVLLTKVQKTIKSFGDATVTIEGNTDSLGSVKQNQKLSQARAENVKEYLVANQTIPAENVKVVGMGSSKPLASNDTAEGRAANRRIDIVINPAQVAE